MGEPVRTCIGCRKRELAVELLRVVAVPTGNGDFAVIVDTGRSLPGRGAWLHPSEACLALAVKRRAFGRALNGSTGTPAVERRITAGAHAADVPASAVPTVQPESGSEI